MLSLFDFVTYAQFAAVFLTVKGAQQVAAERHHDANLSDFHNAIFRDIVIPISATVGLYIVASLIHVRVGPIYLLRLIEDTRSRADGSVAYGHFARTVHVNRAVLYQHLECLRCTFSSFFPPPVPY